MSISLPLSQSLSLYLISLIFPFFYFFPARRTGQGYGPFILCSKLHFSSQGVSSFDGDFYFSSLSRSSPLGASFHVIRRNAKSISNLGAGFVGSNAIDAIYFHL
ncbi:hypothetical protein L228DRAFT_155037 [Xylona heveae TC161]|uniref:Uncharacterized protein n=1 Tax=Xylona heveae (strain CBS 132557 / TC161) TaxID=1328760 RepID=A0A165FXX0_XYLHT|nr:hypothetical protein L228DRAFT_155037 [Xylona heveae TC161]KZF21517.1 hypothetical protein L228DRAFT_155037 [Xylona heveae TC161]